MIDLNTRIRAGISGHIGRIDVSTTADINTATSDIFDKQIIQHQMLIGDIADMNKGITIGDKVHITAGDIDRICHQVDVTR